MLRQLTRKLLPQHAVMPRICRRFIVRDDGTTAVEFAVIALPFFALIFAVLETALVFFTGQVLQTAAADTARLVLTGQVQSQNMTQEKFMEEACARVYGLFKCGGEDGMMVDVRTYSSFSDIDNNKPINAKKELDLTPTYQPGGPGQIVVVRLLYKWPINLSLLGFDLSDLTGEKRLLIGTAAFRNEPFPVSQSSK